MVLTTASVKMTAFWEMSLCSLAEVNRRFRGAYCLHRHPDVELQRNNEKEINVPA
jgi:hypothetical protein